MSDLRAAAEAVVKAKDGFSGARYSSPGRVELLAAIERLRAALASSSTPSADGRSQPQSTMAP